MKHKILAVTVLCTALITTAVTPAFAETTTTTTPAQGRQARLEANREQACERVTDRVADQRAKLSENAATIQERYEKQDARLTELKNKASELGIDISELESYLAVWEGYTDEIRSKKSEITNTIDSAVDAICDGDRETGRSYFEQAKSLVDDMKDVRVDRRQYWVNTIVPELKNIRDELRSIKSQVS